MIAYCRGPYCVMAVEAVELLRKDGFEAHRMEQRVVDWRASAVGVYRLWRDLGYAIGAVLAGVIADALGRRAAMWAIAGRTFASGVVVALRMTETLRPATDARALGPA